MHEIMASLKRKTIDFAMKYHKQFGIYTNNCAKFFSLCVITVFGNQCIGYPGILFHYFSEVSGILWENNFNFILAEIFEFLHVDNNLRILVSHFPGFWKQK